VYTVYLLLAHLVYTLCMYVSVWYICYIYITFTILPLPSILLLGCPLLDLYLSLIDRVIQLN